MRVFNNRYLSQKTIEALSKSKGELSIIKFKTLDDQSIQSLLRPKFNSDDRSPSSARPELFKTQRDLEAFLREKNWIPVRLAGRWITVEDDLYVIKLVKPYGLLVQPMLKAYKFVVSGCLLYVVSVAIVLLWKEESWFQTLPIDPYVALVVALILGFLFNDTYELETGSPSLYRRHTAWEGLRIDGDKYLPVRELLTNLSDNPHPLDPEKIEISKDGVSYAVTDRFSTELIELVDDRRI